MSSSPILYYYPTSPPARSVLLVAKALGLELELRIVDLLKGEQKLPDFLKINPQHTVPALDDNGKYLSDSHAIITYLVGKYGESDDHPLYPKDLYTRARIDQRLHFESGILFPALISYVRPLVYEGAVEATEKQLQAVHSAFETVEKFLAVDPYLVGDQLTVADLSVVTTLTQLVARVKLDAVKYPKIAEYVQRIEELPYFHDINTVNLVKFMNIIDMMIAKNKEAKA